MSEYRHDFGYGYVCRYCGVKVEDIEDNIASPNCDVVRHNANVLTAIIVSFGVIFCAIPLIGMFL